MGTEKLEHRLDHLEIKQTRTQTKPIRVKEDAINNHILLYSRFF